MWFRSALVRRRTRLLRADCSAAGDRAADDQGLAKAGL